VARECRTRSLPEEGSRNIQQRDCSGLHTRFPFDPLGRRLAAGFGEPLQSKDNDFFETRSRFPYFFDRKRRPPTTGSLLPAPRPAAIPPPRRALIRQFIGHCDGLAVGDATRARSHAHVRRRYGRTRRASTFVVRSVVRRRYGRRRRRTAAPVRTGTVPVTVT